MKDIPMFTTEYGIASLILGEIPYRQEAFIRIQTVVPGALENLLQECIGFCRACGAEKIYATGEEGLEKYPLHCGIYEMWGDAPEGKLDNLWPVTEETMEQWRKIGNEKLGSIDNAATITSSVAKEILAEGGAYFVHEKGTLLGIGWVTGDTMRLLASVVPGAGPRVMRTLLSAAAQERIRLEVASTNKKAIQFYEKMGFLKTSELRRWYRVFG